MSRIFGVEETTDALSSVIPAGFVESSTYVVQKTGYIRELRIRTSAIANTGVTSVVFALGRSSFGTPASLSIPAATATFAGAPPINTWISVLFLKPLKVTAGQEIAFEVLPIGAPLHVVSSKTLLAGLRKISVAGAYTKIEGSAVEWESIGGVDGLPAGAFGSLVGENANLLALLQGEVPTSGPSYLPVLLARWKFGEEAGTAYAVDDIGNIALPVVGTPVFGKPGLCRFDPLTSVLAGWGMKGSTAAAHHFAGTMTPFEVQSASETGVTIEAVTSSEPSGKAVELIGLPSQFRVTIEGKKVIFFFKSEAGPTFTLTTGEVLAGYPQLVQCVYDEKTELQAVWVDGVKVASQVAKGLVSLGLEETGVLLKAVSAAKTEIVAENLAIYSGALSPRRIERNFQAFRGILIDPGHVREPASIGVFS